MKIKPTPIFLLLGLTALPFGAFAAKECPPELAADEPIVPNSMEQANINSGALSFDEINDHGEALFIAAFNT